MKGKIELKKLDGVYVIDTLDHLDRYFGINANLDRAIAVVRRGGFESYRLGRNEIDGAALFANADAPMLVKPEDRKAELHHRYFDIQIPLADETMGVAKFDPSAPGSFDEAKDCGFYVQKLEWFDLKVGEFALFFPGTALHAPACTRGEPHVSRKIIFKVLQEWTRQ